MTGEIIIPDLISGKCAIDGARSLLTLCRSSPQANSNAPAPAECRPILSPRSGGVWSVGGDL